MELLSVELGRSIQLAVADEVRSPAGPSLTETARLVTERYNFAVPPDMAEAQKSGLVFKEGRLVSGNKMINIKELGIFNDGILVDTYHTMDSDFVINDLIPWGQKTFGTREPKTVISRKYVSNIVAALDPKVNDGLAAFERIRRVTTSAMKSAYGLEPSIALSGASWGSDAPTSSATALSWEFNFYRRLNRPYEENRFFFMAPVPTDIHLEWIKALEAALSGREEAE